MNQKFANFRLMLSRVQAKKIVGVMIHTKNHVIRDLPNVIVELHHKVAKRLIPAAFCVE